jgi:hypothetical protein
MGVSNLWKALDKGGVVSVLNGGHPTDHAEIIQELENKVIAVDLSAWLMQAQGQMALVEHFASPQARCLKVVFDRVSVCTAARAAASLWH